MQSSPVLSPGCLCNGITSPVSDCGDQRDGWVCTRPEGHAGDHVACSVNRHLLHEWGNDG